MCVPPQSARCQENDLAEAQEAFGIPCLRLMTPGGQQLQSRQVLPDTGLSDGDTVTGIVQEPQLVATHHAFALWYCGSGVVTWGDPRYGGYGEVCLGAFELSWLVMRPSPSGVVLQHGAGLVMQSQISVVEEC